MYVILDFVYVSLMVAYEVYEYSLAFGASSSHPEEYLTVSAVKYNMPVR